MKRQFLNLLLYVAIAVCFVAGIVTLPLWVSETSLPSRGWFVFVAMTIFLGAFAIKMYWPHRRLAKLWALVGTMLIAHVSIFSVLLEQFPRFPDLIFLIAAPFEMMLVAAVVKLCLNIMPERVKM